MKNWEKQYPELEKVKRDLRLHECKGEKYSTAFLEGSVESLNSKTFNIALLDSGSTKTVCREAWLQHFIQSLSYEEYNQIET